VENGSLFVLAAHLLVQLALGPLLLELLLARNGLKIGIGIKIIINLKF
jgi:hypothetical protein